MPPQQQIRPKPLINVQPPLLPSQPRNSTANAVVKQQSKRTDSDTKPPQKVSRRQLTAKRDQRSQKLSVNLICLPQELVNKIHIPEGKNPLKAVSLKKHPKRDKATIILIDEKVSPSPQQKRTATPPPDLIDLEESSDTEVQQICA